MKIFKIILIGSVLWCSSATAQTSKATIRLHIMDRHVLADSRVTESKISSDESVTHITVVNDSIFDQLETALKVSLKKSTSDYTGFDVRMFVELERGDSIQTLSLCRFDKVAINKRRVTNMDVTPLINVLKSYIPPIFNWYESSSAEREKYLNEWRGKILDSLDRQGKNESTSKSQKRRFRH